MAYKPTPLDVETYGSKWSIATQFNEAYYVRSLTDRYNLASDIPVQPYSFRNGINGHIPLFNYKVYTTPVIF